MNIFKRISSFASNSWRDFVDTHHVEQEETTHLHQRSTTTDMSLVNDENEIQTKFEENFVHRKTFINRDLLKKRNKKKTKIAKVLDDPRSPSNAFARTPILGETFADVLSPFNVKDMLEAVQTAVECTEDTFLNISDQVETLEKDIKSVDLASENNVVAAIDDDNDKLIKIDEICDWNNIEYQEKPLTQSLIVETSTITGDSKDSSSVLDDKEIIGHQDQNCKVVGYSVKNEGFVNDDNLGQEFSASTPKKDKSSKPINGGKNQRTPLMSIGNSPCIKVNGNNFAAKTKFQKKSPKKRIVNNLNRKLPKAPLTPMTPLYRNPMITNNVIILDKENF